MGRTNTRRKNTNKIKPAARHFFRAQISLELFIVIAALLSFFLAFSSAISATANLSGFALKEKQMQFNFEKIYGVAGEVANLGKGGMISENLSFPLDFKLSFANGKLMLEYEILGRKKIIQRDTGFALIIEKNAQKLGKYLLSCQNGGNAMKIALFS